MVTGRKSGIARDGLAFVALVALMTLMPGGGAMAQDMPVSKEGVSCAATPAALPAELSGWARRVPLPAGRDAASAALLEPGIAVDGTLAPTTEVRYALRPEKPGGSVSFGGIFAFRVPEAGRYRVALGSAAWIDVVETGAIGKDGSGLASIAHGHGPDCSGIRKMVDFALEPGDYVLQIAANARAALPLLVTRLP